MTRAENRRGQARAGEARVGLSLPNDPRARRSSQARLTQADLDPSVLEVRNGKVTLKAPTGDRRLVASSADGITLTVTKKGTFRVSALDAVRQAQLSTASTGGPTLDEEEMSNEVHRLTADVAMLARKLNEVIDKLQQGSK